MSRLDKLRVLVADDDPLVRSALALMLGGVPDITLVGEVGDGDEVLAAVDASAPDVVLMDLRMPRVDGVAATALLRARAPAPAVLVLTTFDADDAVLRALRAGARGYLLKDSPPNQILAALRRVAAGEAALSPAVTGRLVDHVSRSGDGDPRSAAEAEARRLLGALTVRERDVALAVGRGLSNAEIGAQLYLSVATVKAYVSRVLEKLGLENRVQVALLAHDAGEV